MKFTVDGREYEYEAPLLTASEIKNVAKVPYNYHLLQRLRNSDELTLIPNDRVFGWDGEEPVFESMPPCTGA